MLGDDSSLGVDIRRKTRQNGIANLSYKEISLIFAYLDADTVLMLHSSAKDVKSFRKNYGEPIGKQMLKSPIMVILPTSLYVLVRFVSFRGTLCKHLP